MDDQSPVSQVGCWIINKIRDKELSNFHFKNQIFKIIIITTGVNGKGCSTLMMWSHQRYKNIIFVVVA